MEKAILASVVLINLFLQQANASCLKVYENKLDRMYENDTRNKVISGLSGAGAGIALVFVVGIGPLPIAAGMAVTGSVRKISDLHYENIDYIRIALDDAYHRETSPTLRFEADLVSIKLNQKIEVREFADALVKLDTEKAFCLSNKPVGLIKFRKFLKSELSKKSDSKQNLPAERQGN